MFLQYLLDVPSPDEVESYLVLQKCLELRKSYVFTEEVAPWDKEVISDPSTPKPNPNPFFYCPEGKTDVSSYLLFLCNSFGLQCEVSNLLLSDKTFNCFIAALC